MATPVCPWYIPAASCSLTTAQKYDLDYLRRYYLVDSSTVDESIAPGTARVPYNYQNTLVAGGGVCNNLTTGACTGFHAGLAKKFMNTSDANAAYPVIIESDPAAQMSPPPLFERNTTDSQ